MNHTSNPRGAGEYISREAVVAALGCERATKYGNETPEQRHKSYSTLMLYEIADAIDDVPAADVVPVVRCGECKHHKREPNADNWGRCAKLEVLSRVSFFCKYGARMDKEESA